PAPPDAADQIPSQLTLTGPIWDAFWAAKPPVGADAANPDNLVENAYAELGPASANGNNVYPVPGWITEGQTNFTVVQYDAPGFPTEAGPGPPPTPPFPVPPGKGANFFAGGPNNSSSSVIQTIDVSLFQAGIDAGNAQYDLSAWLGGKLKEDDNPVITAT